MKTKNIIICLSFLLIILTTSANAEVVLQEASEIAGKWNLDYSSPRINGDRRPAKATWEFRRDGTLKTVATDRRVRGREFSITVNFEIKNGKIVADQPGRSRKITYSVVEKEGDKMVLFGGADAFLFFTKI